MDYERYYKPPQLTPPFYVVSDTHFFHDNIVKYSGRDKQLERLIGPDQARRIDHNEYMVQRWNQIVGPENKVLHLGDLFCWYKNGKEKFERQILSRLNGDKYLILGNHDKESVGEYRRMGFTVVDPFMLVIDGQKVSFNHYPLPVGEVRPGEIRVHGHIHNSGYSLTADRHDKRSTPTRHGHINVSVEVIDYTPILISDLLS